MAARLYAYTFLGDFVLLYPVYALLFADAGLSTAEISSLFALWSIASVLLELPSGLLADATSRRLLLAVAPLLTAAGYGLWIFAPSFPSFALGFVLWGAQGALQSGALEALVHDELDRAGAAARYPAIMGRASALGSLACAAATGVAAPALAAGGFTAVGSASIAAALLASAVGATLPEHRDRRDSGGDQAMADRVRGSHAAVLRTAVAVIASRPRVRAAVLLVAGATAIWGSLDEYLPLLAVQAGAATEAVPLLILVTYAGMSAGGLVAGTVSALSTRGLAAVLMFAAGALAAGSLARASAGFALIALAFAAFQALSVAADARLQAAIEGDARATITSLAGLTTEVLGIGVFAAYAAGSQTADHATLFAVFAGCHVGLAAWMTRKRRSRCHEGMDRSGP